MIIRHILENLGKKDGAKRLVGIWDTILKPEEIIVPHFHESLEEVYYFVEGGGTMVIDAEHKKVQKGYLVYIPPGSVHGLLNDTTEDVRLITISIDITGDIIKDVPYIA